MTFDSVNRQLTGRCSMSRKVANNTYLEREEIGGTVYLRLHRTRIIAWHPNGDTVLNTSGWLTVTTKARLNEFLSGWRVWSDKGVWYLSTGNWDSPNRREYPYEDGIIIHTDDTVTGYGEDPKAKLKLKRRIAKYVEQYFKALETGDVPAPGAGDCFYCGMQVAEGPDKGKSLGAASHNTSHLDSHIEEHYYVPSLLANAIERFNVSPAAKWYLGSFCDTQCSEEQRMSARRAGEMCKDQLVKALRRYITEQYGMQG